MEPSTAYRYYRHTSSFLAVRIRGRCPLGLPAGQSPQHRLQRFVRRHSNHAHKGLTWIMDDLNRTCFFVVGVQSISQKVGSIKTLSVNFSVNWALSLSPEQPVEPIRQRSHKNFQVQSSRESWNSTLYSQFPSISHPPQEQVSLPCCRIAFEYSCSPLIRSRTY